MNIFKKFWGFVSIVRNGLMNFIFLLIIIFFTVALFSSGREPLPNSAPLHIAISGQLVDQLSYQPSIFDLTNDNFEAPETLVRDVTNAINTAANDTRITALLLNLNRLRGGGLSKMEEVAQALANFKQSGKPVIAYADDFSQSRYFLASHADTIYINPMGNVALTGFGYYAPYFSDAIDKLSLKFHLFKAGNYKDAAEPFVRNNMSEESREHNAAWINQLWGRYASTIESNRNLPAGAVEDFINTFGKTLENTQEDFASIAVSAGLVDQAMSRVALIAKFKEQFGENEDTGSVNVIGFKRYLQEIKHRFPQAKDNVGLILASGTIVDGEAPEGQIGGRTLAGLIAEASDDDSLSALIIRVDSGGGSAFASEVIREQIADARSKGLDIYISMGSTAASGGYWIATAANEIWATPSTITGSIGVWTLVPNISESLEKLGVRTDGFGTTTLSDLNQVSIPMSDAAKQVYQGKVDNIYRRFISLVSEARSQSPEAIHEIAQGRVWTGTQALELGLVDQLGSLNDLVNHVAQRHNIESPRVKLIERPLSPSEQFLRTLTEETSVFTRAIATKTFGNELTQLNELAKQTPITLLSLNRGDVQTLALCPTCFAP